MFKNNFKFQIGDHVIFDHREHAIICEIDRFDPKLPYHIKFINLDKYMWVPAAALSPGLVLSDISENLLEEVI